METIKTVERKATHHWTQCVAVALGLATLLATQVATAWALSGLLTG